MPFCDVCGTPVYDENYYEEYDMYLCDNCVIECEEELMWLDEQG